MATEIVGAVGRRGARDEVRQAWAKVALFVGATYLLTLLLNAGLWATGGLELPGVTALLQLQMLIPGVVAVILRRYILTDSAVHVSHYREAPRWVFNAFLIFAGAQTGVAVLGLLQPALVPVLSIVPTLTGFLGTIVLFVLRAVSGRAAFDRAGLRIGRARDFVVWGLAFMLIYAAGTGLNVLFGLGQPMDVSAEAAQLGLAPHVFRVVAFVQSAVVAPVLLALFTAFGEEYGWRGFLQDHLVPPGSDRVGRAKGLALVGLIWGVWHLPVVWMGYNYPGRPLLGSILMLVYSLQMAFVLGLVQWRTGAIWLVAFLHGVNNHTYQILSGLVYAPNDAAFSFGGVGLYSLVLMVPIVALLLWSYGNTRESAGSPSRRAV